MVTEQWQPIVGFPNYMVSDEGKVYNKKTDNFIGQPGSDGYVRVTLHNDGNQASYYVHHLVMNAFVGPCPLGYEVDHIDRNPSNNDLSNLRYVTHSENNKNRGKVNGVTYEFIDDLPEDAVKVKEYHGNEFKGYWYSPSSNKFWYENGAAFRSVHIYHIGNYEGIKAIDIYGKRRRINVKAWKRDAGF